MGRHGTRDDYEVCESDLRHGIASQGDMAASCAVSDEQGATKKGSGQPAINRSKQRPYG
jgi:hypothetical protein